MKVFVRILCLITILTIFAAGNAHAGLGLYGKGARSVGMGNAMVAAGNDPTATSYNPASLIYARDYWGLGHLEPYMAVSQVGTDPEIYLNDEPQNEGYGPGLQIDMMMPVFKRIVFAVNLYISMDKLLTVDLFFPPAVGRYRVDNTFGMGTGFAIQVTKKLSVAYAGQSQLAYNAGTLNLALLPILSGILGLDMGATPNVNPAFELDIISHGSYKGALHYQALDWLNFGLVYSYRNPAPVYIPISVVTGDLMGDINLVVIKNDVSPSEITGGVSVYPIEGLTLAFDLTRSLYSREKEGGMVISSSNPAFAAEFPHINLKDIWYFKSGVEWKDNLKGKYERVVYAVRGGYQFYPTPYPAAFTPMNMSGSIDNDAHFYSGGLLLGYEPKKKPGGGGVEYIALEYFYEYIYLVPRAHKSITHNPAVIVSEGNLVYSGVSLSTHF